MRGELAKAEIEQVKAVKKRKLSQTQKFKIIAHAISNEGPQEVPPFPVKLHVIEHVRGEPIIYEELTGQVLHRRSEDFVTQQITQYCGRTLRHGGFDFDGRASAHCARYWKLYAQRLDSDILPVAQASEVGFTFHRLPWNFEDGDCPTWDEMFSRMSDPDAVMAYLGSFFEPHSDRQNYCWIHGAGGNGKSALCRFLYRVFNGAYRSEMAPTKGDKFWISGLLNARVVVFPDCNNYKFPSSGMFKTITGDDPAKIELKGERSFTAPLVCKLLFMSNQRPDISGEHSDVRRAVFSEIGPITGPVIPTKAYDQLLFDEGAYFLHKCVEKYRKLCPEHGPIPVNAQELADLISDNEEELEMLTYRNFDIEPTPSEPIDENKRWFVAPSRYQAMLDEMKLFGYRRRNYTEFLKRRFKVAKIRVKVAGQVAWRYVGMRESESRATNGIFGAIKRD